MANVLQQLNFEMAELVERVRGSLVRISNGRRSHGAGIIWHPAGLVLTNAHVVRQRNLRISLPDGQTVPAKLLAHDSQLDLAALSVKANDLPAIELGDSEQLQPGQWVLALGHPWGVTGAATAGIVAGVGTHLPEMPLAQREWIAVSLHLRPGHSGGPLVDANGRLVGLNTMIAGPDVGLAVPVHVAKAFVSQMT